MNFYQLSQETGIAISTLRYRHENGLPLTGPIRIRRANVAELIRLAPLGLRTREYARRVNCGVCRLPGLLRKHGVYAVWQRARYQKCNGARQNTTRLEANAAT